MIPLSESAYDEETLKQGKQSTLLSSALKKSKTINATKAVTCKRKSKRTANAAKEHISDIELVRSTQVEKSQSSLVFGEKSL